MRGSPSAEAVDRAEYAVELTKVRIDNAGEAKLTIHAMGEEGGRREEVEAATFRILGVGFDEATFFTCVDPFAPEGRRLYAAGEVTMGTIIPVSRRCEDRADAAQEAIKFVLRIPAEERAAAWERMKALGLLWRSKA